MKMFTTIAVATALLGLAACTKNEPAPAPTEAPAPAPVAAPADNATAPAAPAAPVDASGGGKPAEGGAVQPK
jgi:hypothetical protein